MGEPQFNLSVLSQDAESLVNNDSKPDLLSLARKAKVSQTEIVPKPDTVCFLTHTPEPYSLFTRGSISTITGKAKAGKTTALALLIAAAIGDKKILWIDTEQGQYYAAITQHFILKVAGVYESENFEMYDLRAFNPDQRTEMIRLLLASAGYDIIIIDGVRDLVFDINNPEQATITVTKLMAWSVEFNCHITMVLHQNKGNADVRGHLGTEAINKSEIVISVNKIDDGVGTSIITAEYSRGMPFNDFCITRDEDGTPWINSDYVYSKPTTGKKKLPDPIEIKGPQHVEVLRVIFGKQEFLSSGEFLTGLQSAWTSAGGDSMSLTRAKTFKSWYEQNDFIIAEKGNKGNRTFNKLNPKYKDDCPF